MAILSAKPKRGSGGHWYTATGEPRHTMPTAKGDGERNTTLTGCQEAQALSQRHRYTWIVCEAWA